MKINEWVTIKGKQFCNLPMAPNVFTIYCINLMFTAVIDRRSIQFQIVLIILVLFLFLFLFFAYFVLSS